MGEKPKPAYTNAMGLNSTLASIVGWQQTILKEESARAEWRKRNGEVDDNIEELKQTMNVTPSMFPRSEKDTETLMDGISKEGTGRALYLKERAKINPQDKFKRPLTESQRIGWKCNSLPSPPELSQHHGHKPIISTNFYRKSGIFGGGINMAS
eukprot:GGOE01013656.1.p1 GENE.GGOE01013656.1~~GGOE01013656.1.p1  ORF type:complete len:154 (-),score=4.31 GGOE01013656.1:192-653(-)